MREEEDKEFETRRLMIQRKRNPVPVPQPFIYKLIPRSLILHRRSVFVSTAFIVIGIFAYYFKSHANLNVDVIRWGLLQPMTLYHRFLLKWADTFDRSWNFFLIFIWRTFFVPKMLVICYLLLCLFSVNEKVTDSFVMILLVLI